jgi:hypothetical protein
MEERWGEMGLTDTDLLIDLKLGQEVDNIQNMLDANMSNLMVMHTVRFNEKLE